MSEAGGAEHHDSAANTPLTQALRARERDRLTHLLLHVGNEVVAVLGLLETSEGHLGAGDVLLGVLEVLKSVSVC